MKENNRQYKFDDGLQCGNRRPRLYLARGGKATQFKGNDIPGVCVVAASEYNKCGKWSSTDWVLDLAPGVRPIYFLAPLHGTWGQQYTSWGEVCEELHLPIGETKKVVATEYPRTAKRLDAVEAFGLECEAAGVADETVVVSFGSPTNRAIREGFWESPKKGVTSTGVEVVVEPNSDPDRGWAEPTAVAPDGARVTGVKHTPGHHGGYWEVEVGVPLPKE